MYYMHVIVRTSEIESLYCSSESSIGFQCSIRVVTDTSFRVINHCRSSRSICDKHFVISEHERVYAACIKGDFIANVNFIIFCLESQAGFVASLVAVGSVVSYYSQGPHPRDLLSLRVGDEDSVHVEVLIADEVKGEAVFSLDCETEKLAGREDYAEVGVISPSHLHCNS